MASGRGRETEKTRDSEREGKGDQQEKSKTERHTEYFHVQAAASALQRETENVV